MNMRCYYIVDIYINEEKGRGRKMTDKASQGVFRPAGAQADNAMCIHTDTLRESCHKALRA